MQPSAYAPPASAGAFRGPRLLDRLDVTFAKLYFDALRADEHAPASSSDSTIRT